MSEPESELETKLKKVYELLERDAEEGLKYSGSTYRHDDYTYADAGITEPNDIIKLIDNDIWPTVGRGSISQGISYAYTNFALKDYVDCGIKNVEDMIKLRNESVTPSEIRDILKKHPQTKKIDTIIKLRNKYFRKPDKRIERKLPREGFYYNFK